MFKLLFGYFGALDSDVTARSGKKLEPFKEEGSEVKRRSFLLH